MIILNLHLINIILALPKIKSSMSLQKFPYDKIFQTIVQQTSLFIAYVCSNDLFLLQIGFNILRCMQLYDSVLTYASLIVQTIIVINSAFSFFDTK